MKIAGIPGSVWRNVGMAVTPFMVALDAGPSPVAATKTSTIMYFLRKKKKKKKDNPLPLFEAAGIKVRKQPDLKAKLDKEFSLYIRLRDAMPNGFFRCISCNEIKPFEQADCGHYINRQHMSTRFDEMNCNAQCRKCNRFMEGNIQGYRQGLIAKYGEQRVLLLEAKKNQTRKYSDFEYKELIKYYKALNAKLRKEKGI